MYVGHRRQRLRHCRTAENHAMTSKWWSHQLLAHGSRRQLTNPSFGSACFACGQTSAAVKDDSPVQDLPENVQRQAGDADVPHYTLFSQLHKRWNRLVDDLEPA